MERLKSYVKTKKLELSALALLTAAGCASPSQINDQGPIVDCANGPTTGSYSSDILIGNNIRIGGTGSGFNNVSPFYVGFEKGQGISIVNYDAKKVIYFPSSEPQLNNNEAGIDKNGIIYIRSEGINYQVNSAINTNSAHLDIKIACEPQVK